MGRFFKKTMFTDKDGDKLIIFEPTIQKKGEKIVEVPDSFRKDQREKKRGLDSGFTVPIKGY